MNFQFIVVYFFFEPHPQPQAFLAGFSATVFFAAAFFAGAFFAGVFFAVGIVKCFKLTFQRYVMCSKFERKRIRVIRNFVNNINDLKH